MGGFRSADPRTMNVDDGEDQRAYASTADHPVAAAGSMLALSISHLTITVQRPWAVC